MRFHVLGLGPIGCLVAYHLRQTVSSKHTITLVHKTAKHAPSVLNASTPLSYERSGIIQHQSGFLHEVSSDHRHSPSSSKASPIDSLIVCVKAHHTVSSIRALVPRLTPDSTIVLMQNGMGIYDALIRDIFRNPDQRPHFVLASITHGAWLKDHMHVVHAGVGGIQLGIFPEEGIDFEQSFPELHLDDIASEGTASRYASLRATVAALTGMDALNVQWQTFYNIQMAMRRKVVVNAVINPLTALMDCKNGEIFAHTSGKAICDRVCMEASNVFRAQHRAELVATKASSRDRNTEFPFQLTAESLAQEVQRVAQVTAGNYSSMLMDIRQGRDTEIGFMNGYLQTIGRKHHLQMPTNALLMRLIDLRTRIPNRL
ncbi:2-dehydropantoate 2-reductase-like protein [Phanerochaete sordida]|uniref:2-dehydropantoate 2-reductase n=1 Tax=Phanerochaete sordida TaxID=48140 RepID=A0A9P3G069_9APHY|nr:2-dehydropantoate 2-reductase-like protein [Phanerochaete sordida]